MNRTEAQTRSDLIDRLLTQSGWNVKDPVQVVEEFDILTSVPDRVAEPRTPYEGHQFSDYVLLGKNGKPLAVVEAKKTSKDAALGREQAKQYCQNIQKQLGGELPFCFYTNGLLLCREKSNIEVEFALHEMNKPMGISEYILVEALPNNLKVAQPIEAELQKLKDDSK